MLISSRNIFSFFNLYFDLLFLTYFTDRIVLGQAGTVLPSLAHNHQSGCAVIVGSSLGQLYVCITSISLLLGINNIIILSGWPKTD